MNLEDPDAARRIAVHARDAPRAARSVRANRAEMSRASRTATRRSTRSTRSLRPTRRRASFPRRRAAARLKARVRRGLALEYLEKADEAEAAFEAALETSATCAMAIEGLRRIRAFKNVE